MNRIDIRFTELKKSGKKALITFITAGDPDLAATIELVDEMVKNGADIIELGIPFSDPAAEGPVIQKANMRALINRIRLDDVFDCVRVMRKTISVPMIFLLYFNSILQYGVDRFFEQCKDKGVDGVIIPDLPFEEKAEISEAAFKNDIYDITMIAPSSGERIKKAVCQAKGFVYCVSSLGVTGTRDAFYTNFEKFTQAARKEGNIPLAVGFGIKNAEQAKILGKYFDGIIIGSAIVEMVGKNTERKSRNEEVGAFVDSIRKALDD